MSVDKLAALYLFTYSYHSGQWSRGYKMNCTVQRALKRKGIMPSDCFVKKTSPATKKIYHHLVKHYAEVI